MGQLYKGLAFVKLICTVTLLIAFLSSCKKDWLEIKPNKSSIVVTTLSDFQGLMDNPDVCLLYPNIGEVGSDNIFVAPNTLISQTALNISNYLWAGNGWPSASIGAWSIPYQAVLYCNTVIEGLKKIKITESNKDQWNSLYGTALFNRGSAFFNIASLFSKPYNKVTASSDLGIPIRLEPDANVNIDRGTIKKTYDQIISDLRTSLAHLPNTSMYKTRPTKQAAYGMLSRVYLAMEEYDSSYHYSDLYLQISNSLLDYNTLSPSASISMPTYNQNPEVIFHTSLQGTTLLTQSRADIDSILYKSYSYDDLRLSLFFRNLSGRNVWKGSYSSSLTKHFSGIATNEILLIRAECNARKGKITDALSDLNSLLSKRWKLGTFIPITTSNIEETVKVILVERQKELLFRGIRWTDLRRLNQSDTYKKTITRLYNNQTYTLTPSDKKYVWPIPDDEITYSGIEQNPRQ